MVEIAESSLNRVLSHLDTKDIAMITAFRTDPELGYSKAINKERNKKLESDLDLLGYKGYVKVIGYWNETPDVKSSVPVMEESYLVLNTGSKFSEFVDDIVGLAAKYDQQGVLIWNHKDKKAEIYNAAGKVTDTLSNFNLDSISQGWTQIKGHKIAFTEAILNPDFSDRYNQNGNFITAMSLDARKKKWRKNNV